jgi:hypothetical protein
MPRAWSQAIASAGGNPIELQPHRAASRPAARLRLEHAPLTLATLLVLILEGERILAQHDIEHVVGTPPDEYSFSAVRPRMEAALLMVCRLIGCIWAG